MNLPQWCSLTEGLTELQTEQTQRKVVSTKAFDGGTVDQGQMIDSNEHYCWAVIFTASFGLMQHEAPSDGLMETSCKQSTCNKSNKHGVGEKVYGGVEAGITDAETQHLKAALTFIALPSDTAWQRRLRVRIFVFCTAMHRLPFHVECLWKYGDTGAASCACVRVFLKAPTRPLSATWSLTSREEGGGGVAYLPLNESLVVHLIPTGTWSARTPHLRHWKAFESRLILGTVIFPWRHLHAPGITGLWGDYRQGERGYKSTKKKTFHLCPGHTAHTHVDTHAQAKRQGTETHPEVAVLWAPLGHTASIILFSFYTVLKKKKKTCGKEHNSPDYLPMLE